MLRRTIIFLVRKKLGLKKNEKFKFCNQKNPNEYYWFTDTHVMKRAYIHWAGEFINESSSVSLNWLLNDNCEIERVED